MRRFIVTYLEILISCTAIGRNRTIVFGQEILLVAALYTSCLFQNSHTLSCRMALASMLVMIGVSGSVSGLRAQLELNINHTRRA